MACACHSNFQHVHPPEVCDGAAQLVNPLDIDDIAAAMRRVLGNGFPRATMIARGIERTDFSWERAHAKCWVLSELSDR